MKKAILICAAALVFVIILVVAWTTVVFNNYSPDDQAVAPDSVALGYYIDSYVDSRNDFRKRGAALRERFKGVDISRVSVPSRVDNDLTVDVLYIPAQSAKKRLLVLSSGTHGVEGFVGAAIQRMFLDEMLTKDFLDTTGVLLIHSLNPYGFKYERRVTENNVDLNRNSDTDKKLFSVKNEGYPAVSSLINPEGQINTRSAFHVFYHLIAVSRMLTASMKSLRQAILQGQYEFPRGVYFGGSDFEPQITGIAPAVKAAAKDYPLVMNIDLHTGYGERGKLHLFPNPVEDTKTREMMETVFRGYGIDWGDSDDFYTVTGDFSGYLGKLLGNRTYLPMTFEYGTLNSQTTMGSLKSLHTTISENQGIQFGFSSPENEKRVKTRFKEMYYPSSEAWKIKVVRDTRELLKASLERFITL